jgi:hypothetical protein
MGNSHLDTLELWKLVTTSITPLLKLMCKVLETISKGDIDGSQVGRSCFYVDKDIDRLLPVRKITIAAVIFFRLKREDLLIDDETFYASKNVKLNI